MGFIDKIKQTFSSTEKYVSHSDGAVARNFTSGQSTTEQNFRGIAYKVVDKIGQSVSKYQPQVHRNANYLETHPFYNLYNKPNSDQKTGAYLTHLWAMLDEIYGKTFWYLVRGENTRKIKELYLLDPSRVQVHREDGEIIGYTLHKWSGEQVPFTVDEIYFDKTPNPFNPNEGISAYDKASTYIEIEGITADFTLSYMKNNASPSGIVSLPNMDKNLFQKFVAQWREDYEGPYNAGKTGFIRGGEATFQAVGATLKDIDQKVTRDMAKEDVLAMFEMPKAMLGISDETGLGRASVETLDYIYSKEKIEPKLKRLDNIFTNIWAMQPTERNGGNNVTIKHENVIPADKEYKLAMYEKLTGRVLTPNEVRAELGLEPLDGGDVLDNAKAAPPPAQKQKVVFKKKITKAEQIELDKQQAEKNRVALFKVNDHYEAKMEYEISSFYGKLEKRVIAKVTASKKAFDEWTFDVDTEAEKLSGTLTTVAIDLMEAQAENISNWITGEKLEITVSARNAIKAEIGNIVGLNLDDTKKALEETLTVGQSQGESLAKLKKRVEAEFEGAKGYRAKRIAQTESARLTNMAVEMSYKANGYDRKQWHANPRACEFCNELDGKIIEIGQQFAPLGKEITGTDGGTMTIDYRDVQNPPIHPNCKCSLNPIRGEQ